MKKRILTLGAVLVFLTVLVAPNTVLAYDPNVTNIYGTVPAGYAFQAPLEIELYTMFPAAVPYEGSSTSGYLEGNNPTGYTVTGADTKGTNTGYMTTSGGTPLGNKLEISDDEFTGYVTADTGKTWVDSSGPTSVSIDLYVRQLVEYTDTPGSYSLNITFTVTENS